MTARVISDGDISEPFNLRCRVKQGLVMAPTLFAQLYHDFPSSHGKAVHTRNDRNLLNLACFRAKIKTHTVLINKLLMMQHSMHSVCKLLELCNAFSASCSLFALIRSTKGMV